MQGSGEEGPAWRSVARPTGLGPLLLCVSSSFLQFYPWCSRSAQHVPLLTGPPWLVLWKDKSVVSVVVMREYVSQSPLRAY